MHFLVSVAKTDARTDLGELFRRIKPDFDPTTADTRHAWKTARREPVPA